MKRERGEEEEEEEERRSRRAKRAQKPAGRSRRPRSGKGEEGQEEEKEEEEEVLGGGRRKRKARHNVIVENQGVVYLPTLFFFSLIPSFTIPVFSSNIVHPSFLGLCDLNDGDCLKPTVHSKKHATRCAARSKLISGGPLPFPDKPFTRSSFHSGIVYRSFLR